MLYEWCDAYVSDKLRPDCVILNTVYLYMYWNDIDLYCIDVCMTDRTILTVSSAPWRCRSLLCLSL